MYYSTESETYITDIGELLAEQQFELKKLKKENDNLKADFEELLQENESLKEREHNMKAKISENGRRKESFSEQLSQTTATLEQLAEQLQSTESQLNYYQSELNKLEEENSRLKNDVKDLLEEKEKFIERERDMAAEIFESIGRRNETLSEQLAHATAMFDEQFEQLKLAEIQINDYKLELEKQAELIEELQQQCSELESQLHQPSLYRELKEAEESICCSTYNSGDSPATSIRSSPSLLEEFSALNINFDEIRFYQTIDELRAEKFQLEEEKAQSKEDNDKKMSELQVKFAEEKAMLEEKISTLQRRSSVPSWLTILFVAILFIICARLLAFINSGDEHFTVFGTWPHTMIDYITKPPV